jgi:hypothetical protein
MTFIDLGDLVALTMTSSWQRRMVTAFITNARHLSLGNDHPGFGVVNAQVLGSSSSTRHHSSFPFDSCACAVFVQCYVTASSLRHVRCCWSLVMHDIYDR